MLLTFGEKLKEARKQKNFTQKQLAKLIGAAHNSISDWENNKNKPDPDTIELLCGVLKVTPNYLLASTEEDFSPKEKSFIKKYRFISEHSPEGVKTVNYILDREHEIAERIANLKKENLDHSNTVEFQPISSSQKTRTLNYYQRLASAGTGQFVFDDVPVDLIEIPDISEYKKVKYAIGVNGRSMEPLYYDGDILLVEPCKEIDIGEIGIFIVDGDSFVKKLGKDILISVNEDYSDIPITKETHCLGLVVDKISSPPDLSK